MTSVTKLDRYFFAAALLAFGIQHFLYAKLASGLGPPWFPASAPWMILAGGIFITSAIGMASGKARAGAALGFLLLLYASVLYAPKIVSAPRQPGPWTSGFEVLAISGAALAFLGRPGGESRSWPAPSVNGLGTLGRYLFAISLPVFGVQHLLYGAFVATLVPAWMPARLFWAYFIGVALIAAGLSIASDILARWAALLLGLMFFMFVVTLHLPRVAHAAHNSNEWTSLFVALAMCGGSLTIATALPETPPYK